MLRRLVLLLSCAGMLLGGPPALCDYDRLPLVFEPNQGQADAQVKFLARAGGFTLFLTEREAVLAPRKGSAVRMRLVGSDKARQIEGLEPTGGISNYFIGNDESKHRTNIPHYRRVQFKSVYPGVDLVYYGNPHQLEYDLVVAPGADTRAIQVEYEGVESLRIEGGDLVLTTSAGELRQKRPQAYQASVPIEVSYRLAGKRRVG